MGTKASRSGDRPSKADDLQNHSLKSRAAGVSIASNATLIAFKLAVGIMSGSIAIISEALHSGSDLVAALIAFWSVRRAAEPPDERHHYGHEKVENLSGVIEALLIIAAAGVIIFEGVMKIIDGPELDHIWLGIGVMVISGVDEPHRLAQGVSIRSRGGPTRRRSRPTPPTCSPTSTRRSAWPSGCCWSRSPAGSTSTRSPPSPSPSSSSGRATNWSCSRPACCSTRRCPTKSSRRSGAACASTAATSSSGYHKLRARRAGSRRHVDLHVMVDADLTVTEAHDIAEHIEEDIRACIPNTDVLVHVEPRAPERLEDGEPRGRAGSARRPRRVYAAGGQKTNGDSTSVTESPMSAAENPHAMVLYTRPLTWSPITLGSLMILST